MIFSQTAPNKYWIQFIDKKNSAYTLADPIKFLSQKTLDKRIKYGIPILENDIPVTKLYVDSIQKIGFDILTYSRWFNAVTVYTTDTSLLDTIKKISFIKKIEKSAANKHKKETNDKFEVLPINNSIIFPKSLHYGNSQLQTTMVKGDYLHDNGFTAKGITIAVLDGGFKSVDKYKVFDSIRIKKQLIGKKDFVDNDTSVFDIEYHGMSVLSVMAANISGDMIGSAPNADYLLLRTEDSSSEFLIEEDNWIAAAEYADSIGVDIISSSLGYQDFDNPSQNHLYQDLDGNTTRITQAADIAAAKGILVVISNGNDGNKAFKYMSAPADADSILSIGATDVNGMIAPFSSIGPTIDNRIKPNVVALGYPTVICNSSGTISTGNGTSYAAPIISGFAACLWQAYPLVNNLDIIEAIEMSSSKYMTPDANYGYGIPNFEKAYKILEQKDKNKKLSPDFFDIYPNPITDYLNIQFLNTSETEAIIDIFNLQGIKIYSSTIQITNKYIFTIYCNEILFSSTIFVIQVKCGKLNGRKKLVHFSQY